MRFTRDRRSLPTENRTGLETSPQLEVDHVWFLTVVGHFGVAEEAGYIGFQDSQRYVRVLPGPHYSVLRLHCSLRLLHGSLRVEGPIEGVAMMSILVSLPSSFFLLTCTASDSCRRRIASAGDDRPPGS